ncbi:hypothetical protein [Paenibacillus piscarius]|uniref:hypothetical protein n=1 Tax=Paenibacillus piscarius TaxID=1089681 RepID=UPI001EE80C91|nr:hypothetical protein [Paenibacillus piscarius]
MKRISFCIIKKWLNRKDALETASFISTHVSPIPFEPYILEAEPNSLLSYIYEYYNDKPSDLYIAKCRDKYNKKVIVVVDLHEFKKRVNNSMKLRLFYATGEVPSFLSLGYISEKNCIYIYDSKSQQERSWHGSILLIQLRELCRLLNSIIDMQNEETYHLYKNNEEILKYLRTVTPNPRIKNRIESAIGEICPDLTIISEANLIKFYKANEAILKGKVYIPIDNNDKS